MGKIEKIVVISGHIRMQGEERRNDFFKVFAIAVLAIVIATGSCRKASPSTTNEPLASHQNNAIASPDDKHGLQYKDSILYFKSSPKNYSVRPHKIPKEPGYFIANPEGLIINATNGTIDVNNSEAGLRYMVYYMSRDNAPIDSASITISGIDYEDGIFELRATPDFDRLVPVYEGSGTSLPCTFPDGVTGGSIQCLFDETDLNGDGTSDIEGANRDKLRVNRHTGSINLEKSFNEGVFGSTNPSDGATKDFTIHYRLNDGSRKALNKIKIRLYHFSSMDKIPSWLIDELKSRKEKSSTVTESSSGGTVIQSNIILSKPKRPPLIIIVSGLVSR